MQYGSLKIIHIALALTSVSGFILRWLWHYYELPISNHRLTRTLPHIIDTLFLASGIGLAYMINLYPFQVSWLSAKLFGLIGYIVLGSLALKRAPTVRGRTLSFIAAITTFIWIISVARLKSPWGFWSVLM